MCSHIFQKTVIEGADFFNVVETFLQKGTHEEASLFVRISRKLWFRQNDLVFNGTFIHPNKLVKAAKHADEEFLSINETDQPAVQGTESRPTEWWTAPKTNWDAALDDHNGRIGLGVMIGDYRGKVFVAKCFSVASHLEPMAAKASGAYHVAMFSKEVGVHQLTSEGDAK